MTPLDPKDIPRQTAMDVAREMISQPALFSEFDGMDGFTPPPQAVQRYTGERSTQDEQKMLKVGAMRLLGASDREIEQCCGVTRRTIPVLLAELEKSGRITPLKQRLAQATGDNAERANIALRFLLERVGHATTKTITMKGEDIEVPDEGISMELAAMIKAVSTALGITTEKVLLLTGQATEIVETRVGAGREAFDAWWKESVMPIQATVNPPTDFASDATLPISAQITPHEPPRDGPDTSVRPKRMDEPDDQGGGGVDGGPGPGGPTG